MRWNASNDIISGSAGIGLACLSLHKGLGDDRALQLARRAADALVDSARVGDSPSERCWPMREDHPRLMPNFSHGTAGVAYFLATLHEHLVAHGRQPPEAYLDAARAGARRLIAMADREAGFRVFHHTPGGEDLFYLGYCHGPAGTARLFARLASADPEGQWGRFVEQSAEAIRASGIPGTDQPGFWDNAGQCCGSAGVVSFLCDAGLPNERFGALRESLAADVIDRAEPAGAGLRWPHAEHRVQPELILDQAGYMQGAAGIGLMFLQLDAMERGRAFTGRLPDSPF